MEYQIVMTSMQVQFEEYRTVAELLFDIEMVKLNDEIGAQALKYEQEILYVIQAKDKFYLDLMITKDAKIMRLIDGSDLQSLMQLHELNIEVIRKEHAKDVEKVRSEHESESKNVLQLLQRQNVSLESKGEKLQAHLKMIEIRLKESIITIDQKNKAIIEKDNQKLLLESEFQQKASDLNESISTLIQEKQRLRHKVIRLNLRAKGEGEDSVENIVKRISNEISQLKVDYDGMVDRLNFLLNENSSLSRKLREQEKLCSFFEKEVTRRGLEYQEMTITFESFLSGRAKQVRKEQSSKLLQIARGQEKPKSPNNYSICNPFLCTDPAKLIRSTVPDRGVL